MNVLLLSSLLAGCILFADKEVPAEDTAACFEDDLIDIYYDNDGDGYGADASVKQACEPPSGYVTVGGDCSDHEASISPGEAEIPYDGIDNDCSGADLNDVDGDGFLGQEAGGTDCDDDDADINPGADEVCDGLDNDCDGDSDEDAADAMDFYADNDSDGYGDPDDSTAACAAPSGHVADGTDCDDADPDVHPGAEEACDGIDNDCDPETTEDGCT